MPEQEALDDGTVAAKRHSRLFEVDPTQHGLWDRMVEAGRISHQAWLRAVSEHGFVGTCRRCGSYLRPLTADERAPGKFDYEAQCSNEWQSGLVNGVRTVTGCGVIVAAPGGRLPGTAERERKAAAAAKRKTKPK